jgi:hypothetical protein
MYATPRPEEADSGRFAGGLLRFVRAEVFQRSRSSATKLQDQRLATQNPIHATHSYRPYDSDDCGPLVSMGTGGQSW